MTDDQSPEDRPERAVLNGVLALVGVALVVGLVLAGVALIATRMLGLSGDDAAADAGETVRESLYLPPPQKTTASGPDITLNTEDAATEESTDVATSETTKPSKSKSPEEGEISLSAGQTHVANFGRIDLTGIYPGGEGAVLEVQRFQAGAWTEFGLSVPVSDETFSTYLQTGVSGLNRFRLIDPASGAFSNEVKVTVE